MENVLQWRIERIDNKKEVNGGVNRTNERRKKPASEAWERDDHKKEANKLEKRQNNSCCVYVLRETETVTKDAEKEAMKMCKSAHYLNDSKRDEE